MHILAADLQAAKARNSCRPWARSAMPNGPRHIIREAETMSATSMYGAPSFPPKNAILKPVLLGMLLSACAPSLAATPAPSRLHEITDADTWAWWQTTKALSNDSMIRPGEVAICLEQLEEQIAQVLGELSRPAERGGRKEACETDAEAEALDTEAASRDYAEPVMEDAGNRHLFSVSLNQIDEINLLLDSLRAHGNVVTCSDHAEFADVTLSIMGDAIVRDAEKLRDIIDDIHDEQLLGPAHDPRAGVREERATYLTLPARLPSSGASYVVQQHPTCH